jgi:hypothetical protein
MREVAYNALNMVVSDNERIRVVPDPRRYQSVWKEVLPGSTEERFYRALCTAAERAAD